MIYTKIKKLLNAFTKTFYSVLMWMWSWEWSVAWISIHGCMSSQAIIHHNLTQDLTLKGYIATFCFIACGLDQYSIACCYHLVDIFLSSFPVCVQWLCNFYKHFRCLFFRTKSNMSNTSIESGQYRTFVIIHIETWRQVSSLHQWN